MSEFMGNLGSEALASKNQKLPPVQQPSRNIGGSVEAAQPNIGTSRMKLKHLQIKIVLRRPIDSATY